MKSGKSKLVSICIPAFNVENYIEKTITCLLNQSYYNIEIIVVDDHSSDTTLNILKSFKDSRLIVLNNPKKFAASARNFAFKNSSGDYIIFFDADDLVDNDFVEKQVDELKKDETAIVISKWGRFYNDDLSTYKEDAFIVKKDLTFEDWISFYWYNVRHCTPPGRIIMPRQIIQKTPLWDVTLTLNDDFQFFCEVFSQCSIIKYNDTNFYYRSGVRGLSSKTGEDYFYSSFKALRRGIKLAKQKYPNHSILEKCYANLYKNLEYEVYPHKKIVSLIKEEQQKLPSPNFKYPSGGITKLLITILGWKLTKRLKLILS